MSSAELSSWLGGTDQGETSAAAIQSGRNQVILNWGAAGCLLPNSLLERECLQGEQDGITEADLEAKGMTNRSYGGD